LHFVENLFNGSLSVFTQVVRDGFATILVPPSQTALQKAGHFLVGGADLGYVEDGLYGVHAQGADRLRVLHLVVFCAGLSEDHILVHGHVQHGAL